MNFSVSGNNNGQIVGKDAYYSTKTDRNEVAGEILKSQGGGKKYGFDSGLLVQMSVQQQMGGTIPELKQNITNANVKIGALTSLTSTMNTFLLQTVEKLSDASFLSGFDVNVSDKLAASATVNEGANITKATQYSLNVTQVASAQTLTTGEYDPSQPIGKGSMEFSLGSYDSAGKFSDNWQGGGGLIKVDETDTVSSLADKINDANMGITATVITTPSNKQRLAIYSNKTGADHAINIKTTKDSALPINNIDSFNYNGTNTATFTEKVGADNSKFSINGIDFEYTSNDIKDVMGLDLKITGKTTTPAAISVSQDTNTLVGNVQFFVDNFNSLMDVTSFLGNPSPGEKFQGSLHDSKVLKDLKQSLSDMDFELAQNGNSLEDIGIKTDEKGYLSFDRNKLEKSLKANPQIINDVLLNKNHSTTHAISIKEIGNTKTGGYYTQNGKYDVEITEKSAPAKLHTGSVKYPVSINATNSTIKMTINGIKVDIKMQEGKTYDADQLALEISNQINRNDAMKSKGDGVIVKSQSDGSLELTSSKNGSKYSFEVDEDNKSLGFTTTLTKNIGKDVAGKINGVHALGDGDALSSMFDKSTKGLVLNISSNVQIGKPETITIQRGYLTSIKNSMSYMINNDKGVVKAAIKDYEKSLDTNSLDSLVSKLDAAQDKSDKLAKQYWGKYSHVESALSRSSSIQDMLDVMYFPDKKDK
ncbi:flagellar filament capping protein FliD [Photobacterium kishitanii]|uniref:flagellar filament capping protein FliD n=1 Tax=Photobacterium kishitanii TaxID=318456 RepID=UPI000432FC22|nr:flagellar filament capping protein FliD [Photobacterium kishitanii]CEO42172.1 putative Flagellar hook-associated protein 2,fliD2, on the plasmid [Photobacterium kishitanii]